MPVLPDSPNGRSPTGRFAAGNPGGPGNPHAAQVAKLRSALLKAVTPEDMEQIVGVLVARAKEGDVTSAREVILRTLGRPLESDIMDRLERLEAVAAADQAMAGR